MGNSRYCPLRSEILNVGSIPIMSIRKIGNYVRVYCKKNPRTDIVRKLVDANKLQEWKYGVAEDEYRY